MSNPLVHAFFLGRAFAEAVSEEVEATVTKSLSDLGKFDAEQRERLRQFVDRVNNKANAAEAEATTDDYSASNNAAGVSVAEPTDLQATIDELRAEIAQLRSALQQYRSNQPK